MEFKKKGKYIKRRLISRDMGASTAQDIRLLGQVTNYKICNSILTICNMEKNIEHDVCNLILY